MPLEKPLPTPSQFKACLLGGAVGDVLGAPVEFDSRAEILRSYESQGITDYDVAYDRLGAITDDTQLTLFTAEGLLRAQVRHDHKGLCHLPSVVSHAYLRWLETQGYRAAAPGVTPDGILFLNPELHARRAPGTTCLQSLATATRFGQPASNNSKGCGAIMRIAPVALFASARELSEDWVFQTSVEISALTHGHPTGQIASAFFALLLYWLLKGYRLEAALHQSCLYCYRLPGTDETLHAVDRAIALSQIDPSGQRLAELGEGWVADEALAIAVYCSLISDNFEDAVVLAVNHSGDSDSTGLLTGNIRGVTDGLDALPERWLRDLELKELISTVAEDLYNLDTQSKEVWQRYPGY